MTTNDTAAPNDDGPEIYGPPAFLPGQKVRAVSAIRNDGTMPGLPRGAYVIEAGAVGYVTGFGEFLQRFYVYRVDFVASGRIVGMRAHEIQLLEEMDEGHDRQAR